MTRLGDFLMAPTPAGPGEDALGRPRRRPEKPDEEPTDFRDGEGDVLRTGGSPLLAAPIAKAASASRARVIGRYQPCQLRTASWSSPTCPLARGNTSAIVPRVPAARTTSSRGAETRKEASSSVRSGGRRKSPACTQPAAPAAGGRAPSRTPGAPGHRRRCAAARRPGEPLGRGLRPPPGAAARLGATASSSRCGGPPGRTLAPAPPAPAAASRRSHRLHRRPPSGPARQPPAPVPSGREPGVAWGGSRPWWGCPPSDTGQGRRTSPGARRAPGRSARGPRDWQSRGRPPPGKWRSCPTSRRTGGPRRPNAVPVWESWSRR